MAERDWGGWLEAQVSAYKVEKEQYDVYAAVLKKLLHRACEACGVEGAVVETRPKSVASFAGKAALKREEYDDPVHQFTDLCGGRVITVTREEVDRICHFVREHCRIDEANSPDVKARLRVGEFGYLSEHLVVQMPWASVVDETKRGYLPKSPDTKDNSTARPNDPIRESIREVATERGQDSSDLVESIGNRKAEIQVRTLLQHAWAAIGHDRIYKSKFDVPDHLRRDMHRIAAVLEQADGAFSRTAAGVDAYNLNFASYLKLEQVGSEIERLQLVLEHDRRNGALAHRVARLAMSQERWETAKEALQPFDDGAEAAILRDLGRAMSMLKNQQARSVLSRAIELDPNDGVARCYLGDTYCYERPDTYLGDYGAPTQTEGAEATAAKSCPDCLEAARHYENAFRVAPSEPHVLASYLECTICLRRNIGSLPLLRPGLEEAIRRCEDRAAVGVDLPDAYYNIGEFRLMLGEPFESLGAYAKAVHLSRGVRPIDDARAAVHELRRAGLESLERMRADRVDRKTLGQRCRWLCWCEWVDRFLRLARVGKLLDLQRGAEERVVKAKDAVSWAEQDLDEAKKALAERGSGGRPPLEDARAEAERSLARANEELANAEDALEVREAAATSGRNELKGMGTQSWTPPNQTVPKPGSAPELERPILIVSGATRSDVAQTMQDYWDAIRDALRGFEGTLISGATESGIPRQVGDFATPPSTQKVGYLPPRLPADATPHLNYWRGLPPQDGCDFPELRNQEGFTALEPIQGWIDLLLKGIRPWEVKLLGINGGTISEFEYRLALALGAVVGIVQSSGRAASRMLDEDEVWRRGSLLWLPLDGPTLKMFVQPEPGPVTTLGRELTKQEVDAAAARTHQHYREQRQRTADDPALLPWERLSTDFKRSNMAQIRHAPAILSESGYGLRPKTPEGGVDELDPDRVREMARKEHGRYVAERLLSAWRLGDRRDPERRISPFLVGWEELPPTIQQYDVDAVTRWPDVFGAAGLEIYDMRQTTAPTTAAEAPPQPPQDADPGQGGEEEAESRPSAQRASAAPSDQPRRSSQAATSSSTLCGNGTPSSTPT